MGKLVISCDQAVAFLKENQFSVMKSVKEFQFSKNKVKVKVKVSILRPWLTLHLIKFEEGVLYCKADSKNVFTAIAEIFIDFEKKIKKILDKENLNEYIIVSDDLNFQVEINKLIADGILKIEGIAVTGIQLIRKKLVIDFEVLKLK